MAWEYTQRQWNRVQGRDLHQGRSPFYKPNPFTAYDCTERKGVYLKAYGNKPKGYVPANVMMPHYHHTLVMNISGNRNKHDLAYNKALAKLDDELTVVSSLFESWYERREAYTLLTGALKGTLNFARNWKNPRFWKSLGTAAKQPTSLPEAWLVYGFGIQPLVGLVNDTMNGLAQPLQSVTFSGTSGVEYLNNVKKRSPSGELFGSCQHLIKIGCRAEPNTNPNLNLINATGLNQPFSSAWSVAPWGWAVDYFVNVSELLSNIELKHPGVEVYDYYETTVDTTSWHGYQGDLDDPVVLYDGNGKIVKRVPISKPRYKLAVDFPTLGSNQAAYLSSALAITLKGKSK